MARFVRVGSVSDFPPGSLKDVRVQRQDVAVANIDGQLYAFRNECTHNGAYLTHGFMRGREVVCIHHWAVFDIPTGSVVQGPAVLPVPVYEVRIVDDDVEVALPLEEPL